MPGFWPDPDDSSHLDSRSGYCALRNLENSGRPASPGFPWVSVSFADRDLFFRD
jgi:hypothetical protein